MNGSDGCGPLGTKIVVCSLTPSRTGIMTSVRSNPGAESGCCAARGGRGGEAASRRTRAYRSDRMVISQLEVAAACGQPGEAYTKPFAVMCTDLNTNAARGGPMTRPRLPLVSPSCCLLAIALLVWAPRLRAQTAATGTVAGRVTDARTARGLVAATVEVDGARRGATTDAEGRYRIASVPAGDHVIRVRRLGYASAQQSVTLAEGQEATADFALQFAAVPLDAIVITGTPGGEQWRAIGNAMSSIDASEALQRSAAPNLAALLEARAPGVIVTPGTGRVGAGPTIQIRGRSSLSLSNEPLLYVDGVRVNNAVNTGPPGSTAPGGLSLGSQNSQVAARLNDIDPDDIERIEIIKGPAAATIYGTEAARGVIQVITKRGASGRTQWTAKVEEGAIWFGNPEGRIPLNYAIDPGTGQPVAWHPIEQEQ